VFRTNWCQKLLQRAGKADICLVTAFSELLFIPDYNRLVKFPLAYSTQFPARNNLQLLLSKRDITLNFTIATITFQKLKYKTLIT
jgi:hypothetical protein